MGETSFVNTRNANSVVGDARELDLLFQFDIMDMDGAGSKWDAIPFDLMKFKEIISAWQQAIDWNTLFWGNHDQPRIVSRFGSTESEELRVHSAKMLAVAMYLLRGTPFLYQGEEIGMTNMPFERVEQLRDIESLSLLKEAEKAGRTAWAWNGIRKKGRDNARTPMQWDGTANAGFTAGVPWIEVNPNYPGINVEGAMEDEGSILHLYRKLIALRNASEILKWGDFQLLLPEHPQLFAYQRTYEGKTISIWCNFSTEDVALSKEGLGEILLSEGASQNVLSPYGFIVATDL